MNTIGVVLLAAATATSGIGKPHVFKKIFRPHAVAHGPAPADGMISAAGMGPGGMMGAGPGGAGGAGFGENRRFPNVRSQIFFVDPPGMQIGWQSGDPSNRVYLPAQLTVPARYNFMQGYIYRLKLTNVPNNPGLVLYPTIEVAPSTPATDAFLTHNPIPIQFTQEDFDQVRASNFVTKVIYLPDPKYQELAIPETLVSTRLEPGVDPIREADDRGTILLIVRLGAIDLEMPSGGTYSGGYVQPDAGYGVGSGLYAQPLPGIPIVGPDGSVMQPGQPSYPATAPIEPVDIAPTSPSSGPFGVDHGLTPPAPGVPGASFPVPPAPEPSDPNGFGVVPPLDLP